MNVGIRHFGNGIIPPQRVINNVDWWLAGNIPPKKCVAAYAPKGAINYTESLKNLHNPSVSNFIGSGSGVAWDTTLGWKKIEGVENYISASVTVGTTLTCIVKCSGVEESLGLSSKIFVLGDIEIYPTRDIGEGEYTGLFVAKEGQFTISSTLSGIFAISIPSGATSKARCYLDNTYLGETGAIGIFSAPTELIILPDNYGEVQGFALYSDILTEEQIIAVGTAIP